MQGRCGERLMCRVVDTDASVTWSGMHRSESTRDAHLTSHRGFKFRPSWVDLMMALFVAKTVRWQCEVCGSASKMGERNVGIIGRGTSQGEVDRVLELSRRGWAQRRGGTTGIREGNGVAVVDWGRMCTARDKAGDLHVIASGVYDGGSGWVLEQKRREWKGVARWVPSHSAVGAREETCKRRPKREIALSSLAEGAVVDVRVGILCVKTRAWSAMESRGKEGMEEVGEVRSG